MSSTLPRVRGFSMKNHTLTSFTLSVNYSLEFVIVSPIPNSRTRFGTSAIQKIAWPLSGRIVGPARSVSWTEEGWKRVMRDAVMRNRTFGKRAFGSFKLRNMQSQSLTLMTMSVTYLPRCAAPDNDCRRWWSQHSLNHVYSVLPTYTRSSKRYPTLISICLDSRKNTRGQNG